jgi:hypothetical protein
MDSWQASKMGGKIENIYKHCHFAGRQRNPRDCFGPIKASQRQRSVSTIF